MFLSLTMDYRNGLRIQRWWTGVVERWNSSEHRPGLSGLGEVGFEVAGAECATIWLDFDVSGRARCVPRPTDGTERTLLAASEDDWRYFIEGRTTAAMALLTGRIRLQGSVGRLAQYSLAFNDLAEEARQVVVDVPPENVGSSKLE
jgi:hypothetical protein